jgi:uroporphyrinogen-III synthase
MKLLVIRPQPGADATAARIEAAGHQALVMPLFAVESVAWTAPSAADYNGILLTSSNAARSAGPQLARFAHLPVYAVGKVTAAAAAQMGLRVSHAGNADAETLLSGVVRMKLLWLAGEDHSDLVPPASVQVDTCIVYRSAALPVPAGFAGMVSSADYVMLHSARAAGHFASLARRKEIDSANISIAALSANIAEAAGIGWKSVRVATAPNDAALLSCL